MAQHRVRVPEPQSVGQKRTNSEDNLYLAVLRASEGKKGSGYSRLGRAGQAEAGSATSCGRKPGSGRGGVQTEGLNLGSASERGWGRGQGAVSWPRCRAAWGPVANAHLGQGWSIWQGLGTVAIGLRWVGGFPCPGKGRLHRWEDTAPPWPLSRPVLGPGLESDCSGPREAACGGGAGRDLCAVALASGCLRLPVLDPPISGGRQ